jgi:hypothetical protein
VGEMQKARMEDGLPDEDEEDSDADGRQVAQGGPGRFIRALRHAARSQDPTLLAGGGCD